MHLKQTFLAVGTATLAASAAVRRAPEIVNGTNAWINDFPYMISLERHREPWCGGAILSPRWIVTAAHCIDGQGSAGDFIVRAGSSFANEGGQQLAVASLTVHPGYNRSRISNDIAIVEVQGAVVLGGSAWPVELADARDGLPAPGTPAVVTGFGATSEGGPASSQLESLEVPVVDRARCAMAFQAINPLTETMFCAGYFEGERDACQGDSGGPLVDRETGALIGVVSWGYGCARRGYPGVYTSIAVVREFIRQTTGV